MLYYFKPLAAKDELSRPRNLTKISEILVVKGLNNQNTVLNFFSKFSCFCLTPLTAKDELSLPGNLTFL